MVVVFAAMGIVGTTFAVVLPRVAGGASEGGLAADVGPRDSRHGPAYESLRTIMVSSQAVLAITLPDDAGLTEIVLWREDEGADGKIDPSEVVLLTHSSFLGTITAHDVTAPVAPEHESFARLAAPIERIWASHPRFCSSWRRRADVTGRVIAANVNAMHFEPAAADGSTDGFYVKLSFSGSVSDDSIPDAMFGVPLAAPLWPGD